MRRGTTKEDRKGEAETGKALLVKDECVFARSEIGRIARAILAGAISFIEGAREINGLRFAADLECDPDIVPFVGIDSETDSLPLGEVRRLWNPDALAKLQSKIDEAEQWARDFGTTPCRNLAQRFG